jgi:hypothetical protein
LDDSCEERDEYAGELLDARHGSSYQQRIAVRASWNERDLIARLDRFLAPADMHIHRSQAWNAF